MAGSGLPGWNRSRPSALVSGGGGGWLALVPLVCWLAAVPLPCGGVSVRGPLTVDSGTKCAPACGGGYLCGCALALAGDALAARNQSISFIFSVEAAEKRGKEK